MPSKKRKKVKKATGNRRLIEWVERFSNTPILVIGDLMLDRSFRGPVDRISPEAPVPVIDVNVSESSATPGGAGNVVYNLVALGAQPNLISVCGKGADGHELTSILKRQKVGISGVVVDSSRPTIVKTRVIAGHQQVCRFDVEKRAPLSAAVLRRVINTIDHYVPKHKGIVISDYGKGVVTPQVIRAALKRAHRNKTSVIVDPKIEHFFQYKGVDCITPNSKEAVEGMRVLPPKNEKEFKALGRQILRKLKSRSVLITRGEKGMSLFQRSGPVKNILAESRQVYDVTGAGDTVIATFALARAVGASLFEAAQIANVAAGIVVAKVGTATASQKELIAELRKR